MLTAVSTMESGDKALAMAPVRLLFLMAPLTKVNGARENIMDMVSTKHKKVPNTTVTGHRANIMGLGLLLGLMEADTRANGEIVGRTDRVNLLA